MTIVLAGPVLVSARRPRSATAAARPRSPRPPSASARRSRSTSPATRLRRAGGLHSGKAAPPSLYGIAPIPDLWPRFPPSARSVRSRDLSLLAPVGETHPEAQSRRDRETSAALRFRGAWFGPVTPEVGAAASPPLALPLRASAAARDTPQSGGRKRPPAHDVSRPSRRGPPQQRHADSRLREEVSSRGWVGGHSKLKTHISSEGWWAYHGRIEAQLRNSLCSPLCPLCASVVLRCVTGKSEIRNPKSEISLGGHAGPCC